MAKKFLTPIGLVSLPSDPATGIEGQVYFNTTIDSIKIYANGVWTELQGGGGGSVIYTANQPDITDLEVGTIWVDSNAEITSDGNVANLDSYLTIISASSTYATKTELNNINLTSTINTASAAAYASASAYTNSQISNINLSSAIQTASAAAVNYLVDGAPAALNTLNELAAALDDNADVLDLYLTQSSASSIYATQAALAAFSTETFLIKAEAYTAVAGDVVFVNSASGAYTITLPSSPTLGDRVRIIDLANNSTTNNITIGRNSQNIDGVASNFIIDINNAGVELIYTNATYGWRTLND